MAKRLGKFELPKRLQKHVESATDTYAKYIVGPLEPGYGSTFGNVFRRILLSSIEGAAISQVKIEGAQHEFQSIEGVLQDVTEIVLNLKKLLFKVEGREARKLVIDVTKEGVITGGDIEEQEGVEVVNPDQEICTLSKKQRFRAEIEVKVGRGFHLADDNKAEEQEIGVVPIDSLFSPVKLVRYAIENTRVGKMTDYDQLQLEVWTDGRITPDEALKEATAILQLHLAVFDQVSQSKIEFETQSKEVSDEQNRLRKLFSMSVNEMELSVRAANCLNSANITTVGMLCMKSEQEMLKYRNFGKKSLNEIKQKLEKLGLSLGMKINNVLLDGEPSEETVI